MAGPSLKVKLSLGSKDTSHLLHDSLQAMLKQVLMVLMVGLTAWLFVTALKLSVEHATHHLFAPFHTQEVTLQGAKATHDICEAHPNSPATVHRLMCANTPWVFLAVILLGSLVRAGLVRFKAWRSVEGDGATQAIHYFLESYQKSDEAVVRERYRRPTFMEAIRRVLMTSLTLGCGGSGGLEGPAIPVGESIGAGWGHWFKVKDPSTLRALQMSGIAAGVCCLLNAPFASAIFALEVVYSERIIYRTFLYSVFAVTLAYSLNVHFVVDDSLFVIPAHTNSYRLSEYFSVVLVAIFCSAPSGLGLKIFFHTLKDLFSHLPALLRAPIGALIASAIALGLWFVLGVEPQHVLGMGENTITDLLNHQGNPLLQVWWVLFIIVLAKTVTTGCTLMTGGSAGLLVPAMVLGGAMGAGAHYLLLSLGLGGLASTELFIVAGIASSLVAVIEVPVASIALVVELFGASFAPPALVAVAISHLLAKNMRVYVAHRWGVEL